MSTKEKGQEMNACPDSFSVNLDDDQLVFYDIECFKYNSLVVFKNIRNEEIAHFWCPDFEGIEDVIRGKTLVGYNNYHYDDRMLTKMINLQGLPAEKMAEVLFAYNNRLISGEVAGLSIDDSIRSIDCFQQIDVSMPSLKRVEGNMGKSIIESDVDFTIDRALTEEEKQIVLDYCRYDVEQTIEVFKLRKHQYFEPKNSLLKMLKNDHAYRWNTTTISANILTKTKSQVWGGLVLAGMEDEGRKVVPPEVWTEWGQAEKEGTYAPKKVKVLAHGCEYVFGSGGLHGVMIGQREFHNIKLLDVGSMYPSIIILLRALGKKTDDYDQIRKDRLAIKHKDKILSNALKLVLNSVYGQFKAEHSILRNPPASLSVCVYGQMALFDLCGMLDDAGYQVVNANTDGVAFYSKGEETEEWKEIQKEWESKWNLNLELDEFDWWYQKDVNNYIAIQGDHVKVKGGETKKYPFAPEKGIHNFFANNDCRILHILLVEFILAKQRGENPSLIDLMIEHLNDPILFQFVLRAGGTYAGVVNEQGEMQQKVNRVFAVRKNVPHTRLFKKRTDGGLCLFPDAPEHMLIWNDDCEKLENFDQIVDINFYLNLAKKKLQGWGFTI